MHIFTIKERQQSKKSSAFVDFKLLTTVELIRIKLDTEPSGYAENLDNWIFLWKQAKLAVLSSAVASSSGRAV
jgi:hypothetical protein